jgi:diguanylate cyclase (GGDEF)-like protein
MTAFLVLLAVWDTTSQTVHRNIYGSLQSLNKNLQKELLNFTDDKAGQLAIYYKNAQHERILLNGNEAEHLQQIKDLNTLLNVSFLVINETIVHSTKEDALSKTAASNYLDMLISKTIHKSEAENDTPYFLSHKDNVYIIVGQSIETATPRPESKPTQVITAYEVNEKWLKKLASDVGLHVSLLVEKGSDVKLLTSIASTQIDKSDLVNGAVSANYLDLLKPAVLTGYQNLFTSKLELNNMIGAQGSLYLSLNAERVSSNFIKLQLKIGAVALLAVAIAAFFGTYLSRKIAKPLELVAQYSSNIAKGQYQNKTINKANFKELDLLISSFEQMQSEIAKREEAIVFQAQHDAVTLIHNRKFIKKSVEQKFELKESFEAIAVNLSDFRHINDVFGYELGDKCLLEIAKRITELAGVCARLTGGKFVWLPARPPSDIELKRLLEGLNQSIETDGVLIPVKVVIGQLKCPDEAENPETFFRRLAIVLEHSKQEDVSIARFSSEIEQSYLRRLSIIGNLRKALAFNQDELSLVYQPKLSLLSSPTKKFEALIRWNNPSLGAVPPDEFIQIAEDAGLINTLTFWVIDKAIQDILELKLTYNLVEIALNISIVDVLNPKLIPYLRNKMMDSGLENSNLTLELTESLFAKEPDKIIANLVDIKNAGFNIAIDDFGTGYSSLSYLSRFPADTLKLDKSFVMTLATSKTNQIMCKRILQLAKDFSLEVVAEGIEDQQALEHLKDYGCDWAQGYYICKPTDLNGIKAWLREN